MDRITARTGSAPIKRLGHTASDVYGRNGRAKAKFSRAVRDDK